jgi:N utilization substance protein B
VGLRAKGREYAMQMLFQAELSKHEPEKVVENFWKSATGAEKAREFGNRLFAAAVKDRPAADELISKNIGDKSMARLSAIDRAILRLGVYELRLGETHATVVIDEAVELAKDFSAAESPAFVNAVLDSVRKLLKKK